MEPCDPATEALFSTVVERGSVEDHRTLARFLVRDHDAAAADLRDLRRRYQPS